MTQKSILITGCSSGIGHDAAHTLFKQGWRVFATCRKEQDCERLRSEGLESFVLDYADEASVEAALNECLSRTGGRLDALFNNGAYAIPGFTLDLSRDALREIFETNFFGYMDLTNRVIPVMMKQGHGRIIQCSSVLGLVAMRGRGAYNSTKFALEGITDTLRLEMRTTPLDIITIEPGPITTKIRENAIPPFEKWVNWQQSLFKSRYEKVLMPRLYDDSGTPDPGELPPSAVTQKLVIALNAKNPKPRYFVTRPTWIAVTLKRLLPTRMLDRLLAKM